MKKKSLTRLRMFRMSLKYKMIVVCLLLLAVPSLIIGWRAEVTASRELDALGKANLKDNVQMTIMLIDAYQAQVSAGKMTLEQAQEQVKIRAVGPLNEDGKTRKLVRKIGENGYVFALDTKGLDVMHPTREGQNIWDSKDSSGIYYVRDIIKNGTAEGGFTYYENPLPGSDIPAQKVTYSQLDPHWGWVVAAGSYMQDFNKGAETIRHSLLLLLAVSLVAGGVVSSIFARHIATPIRRITEQVSALAQGDLRLAELKVRNRDEVGSLASHFNQMRERMAVVIGRVTESSGQLAATGEELLAGSEETSRSTEHITLAIQEVASGAQQQAEILTEVNDLASQVSEGMNMIARGADAAAITSDQAASAADNGNRVLAETLEHMKQIEEKVAGIDQAVRALRTKSESIGEIIALISGISLQTNILALNAGIEASRAGEQGRGFAVVATEVKKLAEQTRAATDQVSELMSEVQREILHASAATKEEAEAVAAGIRLAAEADSSFRDISEAVTAVVACCREVAAATNESVVRMTGLVSAVEQIAAISAETAGQSQGVAASAEEQNASMEEVAAAAHELSKMADELQETVSVFRVSGT